MSASKLIDLVSNNEIIRGKILCLGSCKDLLINPFKCTNNHSFCESCVIDNNKCPVCSSCVTLNDPASALIDVLTCVCPSRKRKFGSMLNMEECNWEGTIGSLDKHLVECRIAEEECSFSAFGCTYRNALTKNLNNHYNSSLVSHLNLVSNALLSLQTSVQSMGKNLQNLESKVLIVDNLQQMIKELQNFADDEKTNSQAQIVKIHSDINDLRKNTLDTKDSFKVKLDQVFEAIRNSLKRFKEKLSNQQYNFIEKSIKENSYNNNNSQQIRWLINDIKIKAKNCLTIESKHIPLFIKNKNIL